MGRKRKNINKIINNKKIFSSLISLIIITALVLINQCNNVQNNNEQNEIDKGLQVSDNIIVLGSGDINNQNNLKVYFLDVGQADSILIINEKQTALIDAGNRDDGKDILDFIKSKGISNLDYIIGTHPHEDHIGGLEYIINNIDVDKIYLPKIQTNTKTYENLLNIIQNKDKKINSLKVKDKFLIGNAEIEVMTDSILNENNLNLSSNIIKLSFNGYSFLFTGDAEKENEDSIKWEKVDILKVGHHGSNTSTSQGFLNQIKPKYAIISVGKDNDYGHPNKKVLNRLKNVEAEILRTDECGTIEIIVVQE